MKIKQADKSDSKKVVKHSSGSIEKQKKKKKKKWTTSIPQLTAEQIESQPKDETLSTILQQKFTRPDQKEIAKKPVLLNSPVTTDFKLHDIQFIEPSLKTVNNLAYDKWSKQLALSREDGSIEILDLRNDFQTKQVINYI